VVNVAFNSLPELFARSNALMISLPKSETLTANRRSSVLGFGTWSEMNPVRRYFNFVFMVQPLIGAQFSANDLVNHNPEPLGALSGKHPIGSDQVAA